MVKVLFEVPNETLIKRMGELANQRNRVMYRAANRAATTAKTTIAKETTKRYLTTRADINKSLKVRNASPGNTTAKLTYRGHHRNLYHYGNGAKRAVSPQKKISWEDGKPNVRVYKARVKTDSSFKPLGTRPKAFVQRMTRTNGVVGLFRRKNNDRRAKLEGLSAPSVPQVIGNRDTMKEAGNKAGEMYMKRMEKEIDNILKGRA